MTDARLSPTDRLQPFLLLGSIGLGLAVGRIAPDLAESLAALVGVGVFVLLYLVMLGVDAGNAVKVFTERRFLALAIGINFVINPVVAWLLGHTFLAGEPDLRVGLLLFLVTPCIGWYLMFTELAEGDTDLGTGLLAVNIVLQVVLLPFYLWLFEGEAASIDIGDVARSIALFLVAPAVAAAVTRRLALASGRHARLRLVVERFQLKTIALAAVILCMFASETDTIFDNPGIVMRIVPPLVIFFGLTLTLALVAGRLFGLPYPQTALLVFTTSSRNSEASLAVAATAFASPLVPLAVVLGPVIELPLLVVMVRVVLASDDRNLLRSGHGTDRFSSDV